MRVSTITKSGVVALILMLFGALSVPSAQPVQAADLLVERAVGFAPIEELAVTASGAAEDTFKACVARIPAFASVGQRILAEQSCAGEEEVRKMMRAAPKF